jgi:site-specific DNA-cytosine methylase
VGQRLREWGYEVSSVDIDPNSSADFLVDVLKWNYKKLFVPGYFDIVTAGVPCQEYSVAKTVGMRNLDLADRIVKRTLAIIDYLKPNVWWIENPRFGMLKDRPFMKGIPFIDLDYCQFSEWGYQKPTRFWVSANLAHLTSRTCDPRVCRNTVPSTKGRRHHRERLGGI